MQRFYPPTTLIRGFVINEFKFVSKCYVRNIFNRISLNASYLQTTVCLLDFGRVLFQ